MTRPTKMDINCTTGVQTIIELTDEEIAQRQAWLEKEDADQAEREAAAQAKADAKLAAQAKLQALGLTPEEIAALG